MGLKAGIQTDYTTRLLSETVTHTVEVLRSW